MTDIARDLRHLDKSLPAPTQRTPEVMERWLSDITECHRTAADEIERLTENIKRLTANPADHRYWEGRYRDEAADNDRLRDALESCIDSLHGEGMYAPEDAYSCLGLKFGGEPGETSDTSEESR
ncbi:hypothetical protein [Thalassobaculum litoreum]|uniref:Uncharacterized protein n=1 Tax=Thalassobaculum litoreum DSM 18839 TaxID=1123362 RepID=A0A8G2EVF8_9PROT|nr:hypothetical protein [Thalassobaculum litoreum]SDF84355.1 hypothetical protein SAMN05660686_02507 [Thalassobaculum litoreum DSM 18839]